MAVRRAGDGEMGVTSAWRVEMLAGGGVANGRGRCEAVFAEWRLAMAQDEALAAKRAG